MDSGFNADSDAVAGGMTALRDGRYEGGNDDLAVDLRVDTAHLGIISADLSRRTPDSEEYVASVRTSGEQRAHPLGRRWEIVGVDTTGEQSGGVLEVAPDEQSGGVLDVAPDEDGNARLSATLWLDTPLNGLPFRRAIRFTAAWRSPTWRRLGLEVEREQDVTAPAEITHDGRTLTLESCLADAGFDVAEAGQPDEIPQAPEGGWHLAQLHTLMADFAQAPLGQAGWNVNLMLLSRSSEETAGLLGIMFDISATLPRQGVAVFADEIADRDDRDAKLLQTAVHELGHALNLAHRFDRDVGFKDSLSHMNYDWRYRGGRASDEFWERFDYRFDTDELAFLRHGPRDAVMPGGAPFRSVSYWVDAEREYTPFLPAAPHQGLQLTLEAPEAGPIFRLGQPVQLKVGLRNDTQEPVTAHSRLLDIRGGFLDVFVRPHEPGSQPTGGVEGWKATGWKATGWKATGWKATGWKATGWKATGWKATGWKATGWKATQLAMASAAGQFVPLAHRCYDIVDGSRATLGPGDAWEDNLSLAYGAGGFVFTEPGAYDVVPLLYFTDVATGREWLVLGRPLMIRVAYPTPREERDALTLFDDEVGVFFTLGGSETLTGARDKLRALREEHDRPAQDPVAAAITRTLALDRRRRYVRFRDGRYTSQAADDDQARALLDDLDDSALRFLDPCTARRTRTLRDRSRG